MKMILLQLFVRAHSNLHVHSLHDQSSQVDVIVDPYVQQLQEVTLLVEEIVGSMGHFLQTSLLDLHFFSAVLEGATISIDTRTTKQVSETPFIFGILSTQMGSISFVPLPLFLPKGRNIIQRS